MNNANQTDEHPDLIPDMVTICGVVVGVDKAKQITSPNGQKHGGEVVADYTFRSTMVHGVFDDGSFIVWNIQGVGQPLMQQRTPANIDFLKSFQSFAPRIGTRSLDITLKPDPCGLGVAASGR